MATLAEQAEHAADLDAIVTLAIADLVRELSDIADLPPARAAELVRSIMPLLLAEYGGQASQLAADYYDEWRFLALGVAATAYSAPVIPDIPDDVVQESLGWALAPLFNDLLDPNSTLSRIAGQAGRLIRNADRLTMLAAAADDPIGTRYARVAREDACAFCRLLASRGADYRSAESAKFVVGEIDPRDPWRTERLRGQRGTQASGEQFHDNCRCDVVAVFPGRDLEVSPQVAEWTSQYLAAAQATGTTRGDLPALLAKWRELFDAR